MQLCSQRHILMLHVCPTGALHTRRAPRRVFLPSNGCQEKLKHLLSTPQADIRCEGEQHGKQAARIKVASPERVREASQPIDGKAMPCEDQAFAPTLPQRFQAPGTLCLMSLMGAGSKASG